MKTIKTLLIFLVIKLLYQNTVSFILNCIDTKIIESQTEEIPSGAIFFVTVIFAPLFETFIFIFLLYYIPVFLFKINEKIFFHFSAILFGFAHLDHPFLVIALIPMGYLYVILYKKLLPNKYTAILCVALVHALSNLVAYFCDNY